MSAAALPSPSPSVRLRICRRTGRCDGQSCCCVRVCACAHVTRLGECSVGPSDPIICSSLLFFLIFLCSRDGRCEGRAASSRQRHTPTSHPHHPSTQHIMPVSAAHCNKHGHTDTWTTTHDDDDSALAQLPEWTANDGTAAGAVLAALVLHASARSLPMRRRPLARCTRATVECMQRTDAWRSQRCGCASAWPLAVDCASAGSSRAVRLAALVCVCVTGRVRGARLPGLVHS